MVNFSLISRTAELMAEYGKSLDARIKSLLFRDNITNLFHCSQCTYTSQYNSAVKDHIEAKGRLQFISGDGLFQCCRARASGAKIIWDLEPEPKLNF